jgi:hypothetical protein
MRIALAPRAAPRLRLQSNADVNRTVLVAAAHELDVVAVEHIKNCFVACQPTTPSLPSVTLTPIPRQRALPPGCTY